DEPREGVRVERLSLHLERDHARALGDGLLEALLHLGGIAVLELDLFEARVVPDAAVVVVERLADAALLDLPDGDDADVHGPWISRPRRRARRRSTAPRDRSSRACPRGRRGR